MNRNLWLQCKGDFVQSSVDNRQENVHLQVVEVDNEATCICEGQRPVTEAKVNKFEVFIASQLKKINKLSDI
jgi:hypothetical protein